MRAVRLSAFTLALSSALNADAQPRVDVMPAWGGWSRPGRVTEVDVRVKSDTATRGTIEVAAGTQQLLAPLGLSAGRALRLHLPVESAPNLVVSIELDGAPHEERRIALAQSESPLLGLALEGPPVGRLEGFHSIALVPGDLPRSAAAYSSIDALVLDAPTLHAMDQRQLGALIGHAAACGRIALVSPDPGAERVLAGAAGCGGRMLATASSVTDATERLQAALVMPVAAAVTAGDLAGLIQPDYASWRRVAAAVAACLGIAALAVALASSVIALLLVPLGTSMVLMLLLGFWSSQQRLVVWAEADPAARVAQYQAWQQVPGTTRGEELATVPSGLGNPRACDPSRRVRFNVDAGAGRAVSAAVESRLFETLALCYAGTFPVMRAVAIRPLVGGRLEVRNQGTLGWPAGFLTSAGRVHALPALGAGAVITLQLAEGVLPSDAAARAALSRTPFEGYAVLWPLELGSVTDAPANSVAWLLVPVAG